MSSAVSGIARCWPRCASCPTTNSSQIAKGRPAVTYSRRLTFAHLWFGFAAFATATVLGAWQMWARSPLPAPFLTAESYFTSVTAHGTTMAYVMPTFFIMGFGYYVAETALGRPLPGHLWAWLGFVLG